MYHSGAWSSKTFEHLVLYLDKQKNKCYCLVLKMLKKCNFLGKICQAIVAKDIDQQLLSS